MTHSYVRTLRPESQVPESELLQLLERMFPEGVGAAQLMAEFDKKADKTNGLLVDAKAAVVSFWKARGYDPKKPEITKQKLGYALDQEEALGCLVVRAMGRAPLFENYQRVIGKRVNNALTPLNAKIKTLKKSGARGEPDRLALLQAPATLNLDPPPPPSRKRPASEPPPAPAPEPASRRTSEEPAPEPAPAPELPELVAEPHAIQLPLSMRCSCCFAHKGRACPARSVGGSLPAALAIYAAVECEQLGVNGTDDDFVDSDDEDYDAPTEQLKMAAYNRYAALLKALKASFPRVACCRDFETGECAHGDQPCKCDEAAGVLPLWPWMLSGPGSRFCPDCRRKEGERRHAWCRAHEWVALVGLTRALEAIPAELR